MIRTGRFSVWPGLIFVLLGFNVVIVAVTVVAAVRTASPVEPDYYTKALHWDESQQQATRNAALGWHVIPLRGRDANGAMRLVLRITDGTGRPLRAATTVAAEPAGERGRPTRLTFTHSDLGDYTCDQVLDPKPHADLRVAVAAGYDLFTCEVDTRTAPEITP